jgi:hypothetical protein
MFSQSNEWTMITSQQLALCATVIGFSLLPLISWRRSRSLGWFLAGLYLIFVSTQREFLFSGNLFVGHDSEDNLFGLFALIGQWLSAGAALGWNPYLGAGQPLEILNNLYGTPQFFLMFAVRSIGLQISDIQLFSMSLVFVHLMTCTGAALLARTYSDSDIICLILVVPILFGGLFFNGLFQPPPNSIMFALVFFWLFFRMAVRTGDYAWWILLGSIVGINVHAYIPYYTFVGYGLILISEAFQSGEIGRNNRVGLCRRVWWIPNLSKKMFVAVVAMIVLASPALHAAFELSDFVSPTRGYSDGGEIRDGTGFQDIRSVRIEEYRYLVRRTIDERSEFLTTDAVITRAHAPFFIGGAAFVVCLYGIVSLGNLGLIAGCALLVLLSLGDRTGFWPMVAGYVPLLGFIRHTFSFASLATFFFLIVGVLGIIRASSITEFSPEWAGLRSPTFQFLSRAASFCRAGGVQKAFQRIGIIGIGLVILVYWTNISRANFIEEFGGLRGWITLLAGAATWGLLLVSEIFRDRKDVFSIRCWAQRGMLLIIVVECLTFSLGLSKSLLETEAPIMSEFVYPTAWQSVDSKWHPPLDLHSMFNKEGIWLAQDDSSMFFLQKDFALTAKEKFGCSSGLNCRSTKGETLFLAKAPIEQGKSDNTANGYEFTSVLGLALDNQSHRRTIWTPIEGGATLDQTYRTGRIENNRHVSVCGLYLAEKIEPELESANIPMLNVSILQGSQNWGETVETNLVGRHTVSTDSSGIQVFEFEFAKCKTAPTIEVAILESSSAGGSGHHTYLVAAKQGSDGGFILPILSTNPNRQEVLLKIAPEQQLIRMENFHPGWQVLVDGHESVISRSQDNFQTIRVPLGMHSIKFNYWSFYDCLHKIFRIGLALAYILLIFALCNEKLNLQRSSESMLPSRK